jgi:hypothetical protein
VEKRSLWSLDLAMDLSQISLPVVQKLELPCVGLQNITSELPHLRPVERLIEEVKGLKDIVS